ncbi:MULTISPECIES: tetratricopeptide repeat protein [Bacillaceae]|uniref:tetratricopeptide repeat protein n=1 Tax=Bacillaceae TaxID=186817 RepID=UPI002FFF94E4
MVNEISIKDKKHTLKGTLARGAVFARSKVIEVLTENDEKWYLIYYKNTLVYGAKLDHIVEGTFIQKVFTEGIVLDSSHPVLAALMPHLSVTIPAKSKLFSHLQLHFPLQEVAFIATTLDAFYEKEQLITLLDKVYFHFKRSGKFLKSFQVVQLLHDFSPSLKSAKERLDSHEFNPYHLIYHSKDLPSLYEKDPLFVELHCFRHRSQQKEREFLLKKQDGLVALMLWLELPDAGKVEKYTEIALQFITMEDWILLLSQIHINPFSNLLEAKPTLEKMLQAGRVEKAALCLFPFIEDLSSAYDDMLERIWEKSDPDFVLAHIKEWILALKHLPDNHPHHQWEEKLFQLSVKLLDLYDLPSVEEKLLAFQVVFPTSEVIRKIKEMAALVEDPDRMMTLGDYYAEFKQYDKAIDCFAWEMELQPQNPSPIRKISKMYQFKGLVKEAAAYQQILNHLPSNQHLG